MATGRLLCLGCREEGHILNDCEDPNKQGHSDWMFSTKRMAMDFDSAWNTTEQELCERCRNLDLLTLLDSLPTWTTQAELTQAFEAGHQSIKSLGQTGLIQLWSDCSLCRCLFAMTPNPQTETQDIVLLPDWTLNRLAGEDGVKIDNDVKRQSATCLVVALKPSGLDLPIPISAHRGDALCLIDRDLMPTVTLGGRQVDQGEMIEDLGTSTSVSRRFDVIQEWINTCAARHSAACTPTRTEELNQIRLLDVHSRKIVAYPNDSAEYIALSYVWGGVEQPSYRLGDDLKGVGLPKTIEDAIWFTKQLERDYLWVDSICIDQTDEVDKLNQINRMGSIYRGSVVTFLALSSDSAKGGIPRISRHERFSQITCCIDGRRLVGLMPTLSQQIWVCPWGKRAWTLQEAVLSPRCLYFSDHQIHFECKAMQCCESLEETRSPSHQLDVRSAPTGEPFGLWMAQQLGPGCLRIDSHSGRLDQYGRKLTLYSFRDMTDPRDGLNAFKGILQKMEEFYPRGWYEGLPVEDFDWALLWRPHYPAERRKGFPSWSWAGWKGRLWHGQPIDVIQPRRIPIRLFIQRVEEQRLVPVFKTDPTLRPEHQSVLINPTHDAIGRVWRDNPAAGTFDLMEHPFAERDRLIFVQGIVLRFALDFSQPLQWTRKSGEQGYFTIYIKEAICVLGIMALDREIIHQPANELRTFILIARDHLQGLIIHHLMLIRTKERESLAERATVVQLYVPRDRLDVLEELSPQWRCVVLG